MHHKGKKCGKPINMCIGEEQRMTGGLKVHSGVSRPHFKVLGHHHCAKCVLLPTTSSCADAFCLSDHRVIARRPNVAFGTQL